MYEEAILTVVTLTFDPVILIGFLSNLGWMCGPGLKKIGQGVLQLLIRNKKVTDGRPTDRPTNMCKAICPLFFEGGHKTI